MCMYVNGAFSSCENTSEVCTHTPAEFASTKKHSTHTHIFIQTHTSENSKKSHFFIAQNLQFALLMVYAPKCMPAQANIHTHIYNIFHRYACLSLSCRCFHFLHVQYFFLVLLLLLLLLLLVLRQYSSAPIFRPLFWLMTLNAPTDCRPKIRSHVSVVAQWPALNNSYTIIQFNTYTYIHTSLRSWL